MKTILFVANSSWYLFNFRQNLISAMAKSGYRVVCIAPQDEFSKKLQKICNEYHPIKLNRKNLNPFFEFSFFIRLFFQIRNIRPEIVHLFTIKPVIWGTLASRILKVRKIVAAITGLGFVFSNGILRLVVTRLYRFVFKSNKVQVIFQNPDDLDVFSHQNLVKKTQCHLILGSGVDTSLFCPPVEKHDDGIVRFVLFARMIREKGIAEFISAAHAVNQNYPKTEFILAGDLDKGNPSGISKEWMKDATSDVVRWLGHVENVKEIMAKSDVAVLPTYYREGVPRSLIEAASSGLPIITTTIPGCREIVKDGENGYLIPPKDVEKLKQAMIMLIENPELREKFGKRGRQIVLEKFDQKFVIKQTKSVYFS